MCVLVHYMYFDIYLWDGAARLEGRKATQAATRREKIGGDRVQRLVDVPECVWN